MPVSIRSPMLSSKASGHVEQVRLAYGRLESFYLKQESEAERWILFFRYER